MINNIEYKSYTEWSNSKEAQELNKALEESLKLYELESAELYNSLEYDQRLKLAFHITRMVYENEFVDQRSYRSLIYDKLGLEPDAYAILMDSGLMSVHNSVYTHDDVCNGVDKIIKFFNIEATPDQITKACFLFMGGDVKSLNNLNPNEE